MRVVIVGGGAAGFFAAIACAEGHPAAEVVLLEKSSQFLSKVRISGGGRCNVTNATFDSRAMAEQYPRGNRALIGPLQQFQASDTVEWFKSRGVALKAEDDGRMFPKTDSSETIIDCLLRSAAASGVILRTRCGVNHVNRLEGKGFRLELSTGESMECDLLLLATGGSRSSTGDLALDLGHTLEMPVPSLFTFHIEDTWVRELAGTSVECARASVPGEGLAEEGALLFTHWGMSGPAILRLSAWGARLLRARDYRFPLQVSWLPRLTREQAEDELRSMRVAQPLALVRSTPMRPLPGRLWERLAQNAGIAESTRWTELPRVGRQNLARLLTCTELGVTGKSANKAEFVTCGGVRLPEVKFKTMESKICPGLFFAGEMLDIDGITGGFNFQAAWTTGWIAGTSMAVLLDDLRAVRR